MSKGTILYVGGFEMPDKNAAAHRVLNNGKIFRELGYDVVFLGISHTDQSVSKKECAGFDCWAIPYPKSTKAWMKYLADISQLKKLLELYQDVRGIIFYNYQAVALWEGIRLCRKKQIFCVADATEWYCASKNNLLFYCIKQADTCLRMRVLQPRMDGIIAISSYLNDYYVKKNCKVVQIPPLVDKQENKWQCLKVKKSGSKKMLVYAGNPGDIKDNMDLVIEGVKQYKDDLELHVIGNIPTSSQEQWTASNIIFHGRLTHQECLQLISQSDFQIFLRQDNLVTRAGFPTKFGESFACGTPVITNAHSNVRDYLSDEENAFVVEEMTQDNVNSVLEKVAILDDAQIECMKETCKNTAKFDCHQYVEIMDMFIKTLK